MAILKKAINDITERCGGLGSAADMPDGAMMKSGNLLSFLVRRNQAEEEERSGDREGDYSDAEDEYSDDGYSDEDRDYDEAMNKKSYDEKNDVDKPSMEDEEGITMDEKPADNVPSDERDDDQNEINFNTDADHDSTDDADEDKYSKMFSIIKDLMSKR